MKLNTTSIIVGLLIGLVIGGAAGWFMRPTNPPAETTLKTAGSTTVFPLSVEWSSAYYTSTLAAGSIVKVEVSGGGSGYGRTSAAQGTVDFGAASSYKDPALYMLEGDDAADYKTIPIAADALAVVVNPSVNGSSMFLKREHIVAIFNGSITTWAQLVSTFNDIHSITATGTISVYVRSEASGTTATFTSWLNEDPNWPFGDDELISWPGAFVGREGNPGVQSGVASDSNGIGYVGFAFTEELTTVTLYNSGNGEWVEANPEYAKLAIPDPLTDAGVSLFDSSTAGAYPIARLIFYIVNTEPPETSFIRTIHGVKVRTATVAFLRWALSATGGQDPALVRTAVGYLEITGTGAEAYANDLIDDVAAITGTLASPLFNSIFAAVFRGRKILLL